ncbi:MAG: hypothetical protein ACREHD_00055, partial [Pirellulales bacterium]
ALISSSAILLLDNPEEHGFKEEGSPLLVFAMSLAVWGSMLLLSLYVFATYYLERLSIEGTIVSLRTLLQNHRFDVSELKALKWRVRPVGGSIHFQLLGSKAKLNLWGYSTADRLAIIRTLRELVPAGLQENWPAFCQEIALGLWDGKSRLVRHAEPDKVILITRKRYDRAFLLSFPFAILLALTLSAWLSAWQLMIFPFTVIPLWLLLRKSVPRGGELVVPLKSQPGGRGAVLLLGAAATGGVSLVRRITKFFRVPARMNRQELVLIKGAPFGENNRFSTPIYSRWERTPVNQSICLSLLATSAFGTVAEELERSSRETLEQVQQLVGSFFGRRSLAHRRPGVRTAIARIAARARPADGEGRLQCHRASRSRTSSALRAA